MKYELLRQEIKYLTEKIEVMQKNYATKEIIDSKFSAFMEKNYSTKEIIDARFVLFEEKQKIPNRIIYSIAAAIGVAFMAAITNFFINTGR